jgi:hypothetical protein
MYVVVNSKRRRHSTTGLVSAGICTLPLSTPIYIPFHLRLTASSSLCGNRWTRRAAGRTVSTDRSSTIRIGTLTIKNVPHKYSQCWSLNERPREKATDHIYVLTIVGYIIAWPVHNELRRLKVVYIRYLRQIFQGFVLPKAVYTQEILACIIQRMMQPKDRIPTRSTIQQASKISPHQPLLLFTYSIYSLYTGYYLVNIKGITKHQLKAIPVYQSPLPYQ